ncbi:ubiquitin-activating enzyme [Trypanosoma grayi]|uniref:ubiquitin-activating enzyme n=1 Tax=Trypanosoma grayi TaxID=71804 RepID=UPI0004F4B7DD|nr:ubiquitin-activating enzyme [Trypanosoma grayi]KEG08795.1 ubiquitin-activating enzyme [Trypanosoma grayi]
MVTMQVSIGHVLFPHGKSLACDDEASNAKRLKYEGRSTSAVAETPGNALLQISEAAFTAAVRDALRQQKQQQHEVEGDADGDMPAVEVHMHEGGKGASFCFVPGALASSLRLVASSAIELPSGMTASVIEAAARLPRVTELTFASSVDRTAHQLPVYWEDRPVRVADAVAMATAGDAEEALLGKRVLVVGAGGIGCELLKVLVLYGFCNVDVFDLDTIDATNLNRQFLFQKEDVGASKAETARKAILGWFTSSTSRRLPSIRAHHANIINDAYDDAFYRQFAVVLNALDNVAARQHVNRMCMSAGVPLIESGTMGYNGQVQPIVRGRYECYDCHPKAASQKTVAVCTIHARPTTMVHCVHYAKELYERLFGDGQRGGDDELAFVDAFLDPMQQQQQQDDEQHSGDDRVCRLCGVASTLARCLFHDKIRELLDMKAVWATQPPVPLAEGVMERAEEHATATAAGGKSAEFSRDNPMSLQETAVLFLDSFTRCARRGVRVGFRKEDDDTVDFVAAVSNLRAAVFHIEPPQSVEEIRSVAGAIVPAIATTNAIVAAAVVQQALCVLGAGVAPRSAPQPQMVYVRRAPQVRRRRLSPLFADDCSNMHNGGERQRWTTDLFLVHSAPPNTPNSSCVVCRDCRPVVRVHLDATRTTLGSFVADVLRDRLSMSAPSVFSGPNVLYEEGEFETMTAMPLAKLMTAGTKPLELLVDDLDHEVEWRVVIEHSPSQQEDDAYVLEGLEAALQLERTLVAEAAAAAGDAGRDGDDDVVPSAVRVAAEGGEGASAAAAVVVVASDEDDEDVVEID